MRISSAFDGGNIEVIDARRPDAVRLRIRPDARSRFLQWFYFRVSNARGTPLVLTIENAHEATYPNAWRDYAAVASSDRREWTRIPTRYDGSALTMQITPDADAVWLAYFAPYPMERHADRLADWQRDPRVRLEVLGSTVDGDDVDCLRIGEGPRTLWILARQHPGETMAQWFVEGLVDRLLDPHDAVSLALLARATFYVVPNMNPDGSRRGHLRSNAAGVNLNRAWLDPSIDDSPEVFVVRRRMHETGVDFCLDVHGDEELPYNFIAGPDGIPSLSPRQRDLLSELRAELARITPDFQTEYGYAPSPPGEANLRLCTNYVAETFGCLAVTLEMPFKDTANRPSPRTGWSPARSTRLGHSCLDGLHAIVGRLRP